MKPVSAPELNDPEVYMDVCSRVFLDKRSRLLALEDFVTIAAEDYRTKAKQSSLHRVSSFAHESRGVTHDELKDLYKNLPSNVREHLMERPTGRICPYCCLIHVSTLDHFLPSSHYPQFSVFPINLVAACWGCNHAKSDDPPTQETTYFHPYFESVPTNSWLHATVDQSAPLAILYSVDIESFGDNELIAKRVVNQFANLGLSTSYGVHAAQEIKNRSPEWVEIRKEGEASLADYLNGVARRYSQSDPNSYLTALYRALADDRWYLNVGVYQPNVRLNPR